MSISYFTPDYQESIIKTVLTNCFAKDAVRAHPAVIRAVTQVFEAARTEYWPLLAQEYRIQGVSGKSITILPTEVVPTTFQEAEDIARQLKEVHKVDRCLIEVITADIPAPRADQVIIDAIRDVVLAGDPLKDHSRVNRALAMAFSASKNTYWGMNDDVVLSYFVQGIRDDGTFEIVSNEPTWSLVEVLEYAKKIQTSLGLKECRILVARNKDVEAERKAQLEAQAALAAQRASQRSGEDFTP